MKSFLLVIKLEILELSMKKYTELIDHPKIIINDYKLFDKLRQLEIELNIAHFHWEEAYNDTITTSLYFLINNASKREILEIIKEMNEMRTQNIKIIEYKLLKLVSSGKMYEYTDSGFKEIQTLSSGKYEISK